MLLLEVPFEEKDEAKALGAFWDNQLKKWYVPNRKEYSKFKKWIPDYVENSIFVYDNIYIVEALKECWRCHQKTKVICFGIADHYPNMFLKFDYLSNKDRSTIHLARHIDPIPKKMRLYIQKHYINYQPHFSKTLNQTYMSNGCEHCNAIQGDNFLFEEPESPFYLNSISKARTLVLYKFKLPYDLMLRSIDFVTDSYMEVMEREEDILINKYSNIIEIYD